MGLPFFAYLLRCADGSYYAGHTDDLQKRVAQHQYGEIPGYTSTRRPLELVWSCEFNTRYEALEAERKIKGWSRAKKEALIRGDWAAIQRLAGRQKPFETGHQPAASAPPQDEREVYGRDFNETVRAEEGLSKREGPSRSTAAQNPVIVLIRPQLGENIGKAARAMLNFGLTELRMVAPRDGWPNPSAGPAAAGADEVLATARVFDTLAEAVADCTNIYATTVRKRGVTKPVVTPEQAAREIVTMPGRSAFLFGPERSGMETDDVAVARAILTVPINPEFGSLNLAQAVILCAYEWSKTQALAQPTVEELLPPAPQEELDGMIAQLEGMLTPRGYYRGQGRDAATRRTLRNLLTKPGWNHLEVRTFRGVLSTLRRSPDEPQD
jgi:tRNA/rRNA methyltransferase